MEVVDGTPNSYQYTPKEDIISSMPDDVINNILERLPIYEALRTGILSREWRYKWMMLTQLVFDAPFYKCLRGYRYCGKIISRLLLHLKGPITKFVLEIQKGCYPEIDEEDINNWLLFLSRKGLKQLTLINHEDHSFRLTSHIFSCLELSHLELYKFQLDPVSNLRGFPNLSSFNFALPPFDQTYNFGKFLTQCPNLESLDFFSHFYNINETDLAKLVNLRKLYWLVGNLHNRKMITSTQIFIGIGSLTKLSDLCVNFMNCKVLEDARRSVPTTLACLKKLKVLGIDLCSRPMVSLVVELICASPNLHYLEIMTTCEHGSYSRIKQLQLQKVKLYRVKGSKSEECLIKSLLACSPLLKKMSITVDTPEVFGDFTTNLLKLHRAFPRAKLKLVHDPRSEPFLCFYL
ncbi:F-box/FBD/LRR-repeat protein-like protein [Tanacetum coccineum]